MKKLATLWVLLLALCAWCAMKSYAEPAVYESGDYKYILHEDGTAKITDYNGEATALTIPSKLDGHRVTTIGDWGFVNCDSLTSVIIPDSVTTICNFAFSNCGCAAGHANHRGYRHIGN